MADFSNGQIQYEQSPVYSMASCWSGAHDIAVPLGCETSSGAWRQPGSPVSVDPDDPTSPCRLFRRRTHCHDSADGQQGEDIGQCFRPSPDFFRVSHSHCAATYWWQSLKFT